MKMPAHVLEALTGPAVYKVRRLLRAGEFASFCQHRDLKVDIARLRKLEQLGLFKPLLRIRQPDEVRKIESLAGGQYHDLGRLEAGEAWDGETRTDLLGFGFYPEVIASWREHGLIWSPFDGPSAHEAQIDAEPRRHEAYYSEFQIWDLAWMLAELTITVSADNAFDGDGAPNRNHRHLARDIAQMAADTIARRERPRFRTAYGLFAQLISDRFYVQTQTDERIITISKDSTFWDWEWEPYARDWSPTAIVDLLQIEPKASASLESQLSAEQHMTNPLNAWRGLTRFVAVEQRKKLTGKALRAETYGEMADMHRRFHELAFGEALPDSRDDGFSWGRPPPVAVGEDPYRALEWVANRFHLNPRPKLVLIVEGATEEAVIPDIFERWFGASLSRYGIQIRNMHGVGNATGGKRDVRSALWRLIDFLHAQQTLVFVLLDREGLAGRNIAEGLTSARSIHFPDRRVTRRDYVRLWRRAFELDNFSDSEIAAAMTALSGVAIAGREVKACREPPVARTTTATLSSIYQDRTGQPLDKVALARRLVDQMFDPACRRRLESRPIVGFLQRVALRAARNHQPTTEEIWEENQRSGYLGALQPGAASRRRRRLR